MSMRTGTWLVTLVFVIGAGFIHTVDDATFVGNIFLLAMTSMSWLFVLLYVWYSEWMDTAAGKSILYATTSFGLLGTQVSLSAWLGLNYPGRDTIRPYLYLALTISMLNMALTLFRYQREARRRRNLAKLKLKEACDAAKDK